MDVSIVKQFVVSRRSVLHLSHDLSLSHLKVRTVLEESSRVLIVSEGQDESSENTKGETNSQRGQCSTDL